MRKLTIACAALASLGATALVEPATAAPIAPMGVHAPNAVTTVQMTHMERRHMRHRVERRMMRRHIRHRMMRHRVERRMMRHGM